MDQAGDTRDHSTDTHHEDGTNLAEDELTDEELERVVGGLDWSAWPTADASSEPSLGF